MKTTITEIKSTADGVNWRVSDGEERIGELEYRVGQITQTE